MQGNTRKTTFRDGYFSFDASVVRFGVRGFDLASYR